MEELQRDSLRVSSQCLYPSSSSNRLKLPTRYVSYKGEKKGMKPVRCLLGYHKFSEWVEVGSHLERECLCPRCGEVEAKYPDPLIGIAKIASALIWKYYMWNTEARKIVYYGSDAPPDKEVDWK